MPHSVMSFAVLMAITGDRFGEYHAPCSLCSEERKPASRKKRVLKVWYERPDFATYCCQHCGATGYAHSDSPFAKRVDPEQRALLMRKAEKVRLEHVNQRRRTAQYLYRCSIPIQGTPGERYLHDVRGITCSLSPTLRFLPAQNDYPPAMIAPFGIPSEPIPGKLDVEGMMVHAVHLTRLKPDGSGKLDADDQPDKVFIGSSEGLPIVLAPANDLGGLAIAEGIEDALSLHQSTGLGAWAAGAANRLPALARTLPHYVESISILVDDNKDGHTYSNELAHRLLEICGRGFEVRMLEEWRLSRAAA